MLIGRRVAWAPAPCDLRVLGAVVALVGLRPADCREWLVLRGCGDHQPTLSCLASPVNSHLGGSSDCCSAPRREKIVGREKISSLLGCAL